MGGSSSKTELTEISDFRQIDAAMISAIAGRAPCPELHMKLMEKVKVQDTDAEKAEIAAKIVQAEYAEFVHHSHINYNYDIYISFFPSLHVFYSKYTLVNSPGLTLS
jgi:hypothetical protein